MTSGKKGALELSVNAIVILVIAIVILGVALAFTKGMFGKVSTQVEEKVEDDYGLAMPSPTDPVTLSKEVIVVMPDEDVTLKVGAYNPSGVEWTDEAPSIICKDLNIPFEINPKTLKPTEQEVYTILFRIPKNINLQSYLCTVSMPSLGNVPGFEGYNKELSIRIVEFK